MSQLSTTHLDLLIKVNFRSIFYKKKSVNVTIFFCKHKKKSLIFLFMKEITGPSPYIPSSCWQYFQYLIVNSVEKLT